MKGIPVPHYKPLKTTLNIAINNLFANWCSPEAHCSLHMIWNHFKAKCISVDTQGHTRMAKKISELHFFTRGEILQFVRGLESKD